MKKKNLMTNLIKLIIIVYLYKLFFIWKLVMKTDYLSLINENLNYSICLINYHS